MAKKKKTSVESEITASRASKGYVEETMMSDKMKTGMLNRKLRAVKASPTNKWPGPTKGT